MSEAVAATKPVYWSDTYLFESKARIVSITPAPAAAAPAAAAPAAESKSKPNGGGGGGGAKAKGGGKPAADRKSKGSKDSKSKAAAADKPKPDDTPQPATDSKSAPATAPATAPASAPARVYFNLVLDETIFHPQGGGQPSDVGTVELPAQSQSAAPQFVVELATKSDKGVITHRGYFSPPATGDAVPSGWAANASVSLRIDADARKNHARLHSAGHLIDIAVASLGLNLGAGKGNHSPSTSYVEYSGTLSDADRDSFVARVQANVDLWIRADVKVTTHTIPYSELAACCGVVPSYLPADQPSRVIQIHASRDGKTMPPADATIATTATATASAVPLAFGCPCGGTHVKQLRALTSLSIRKLEKKGKTWRVKYEFTDKNCTL